MNLDDEASLSSEQLPWPRFGDQLFGPDDDWYNNAFVSTCLDGLDLYASGYLEAAQIVVEAIVSSRRSPDAVVYPIGFLYRHYLELRLKTIIDQGKKLLNRRPGFPETHDLDLLWKTARKIIEEIYWKDPKETVEAVHESMVQFCDLDKDSYAFSRLVQNLKK
jgi:hypothetical protein